ncbi:MAG: ferrous iron transport protein A [Oscillospiraceae bacterium]|nr:ferrous iron transport protein A [Oscillospiraceae bacterium]
MMPLNFAEKGKDHLIKKVGGSAEVKSHLEDLGFVAGGTVNVVSAVGDNLIVSVKGSRIALSGELARRIMI